MLSCVKYIFSARAHAQVAPAGAGMVPPVPGYLRPVVRTCALRTTFDGAGGSSAGNMHALTFALGHVHM